MRIYGNPAASTQRRHITSNHPSFHDGTVRVAVKKGVVMNGEYLWSRTLCPPFWIRIYVGLSLLVFNYYQATTMDDLVPGTATKNPSPPKAIETWNISACLVIAVLHGWIKEPYQPVDGLRQLESHAMVCTGESRDMWQWTRQLINLISLKESKSNNDLVVDSSFACFRCDPELQECRRGGRRNSPMETTAWKSIQNCHSDL